MIKTEIQTDCGKIGKNLGEKISILLLWNGKEREKAQPVSG